MRRLPAIAMKGILALCKTVQIKMQWVEMDVNSADGK